MSSVTIGMPVYNGAEFLDEALAAICAQTYPDLHIIISDNASTDETPEIISKWASRDSRIVVTHRQSENIGARRNFEWVLEKADTPWIMFAAHDDQWSPNYVECLYETITSKPNQSLSVPLIVYTDVDGHETKRRPFLPEIEQLSDGLYRVRRLLQVACGSWYYGLYSREQLRSSWHKNNHYDFVWGHDLIILLPFLLSGKVAGSNDALYFSRETGLSIGHYKPKTFIEQKRLYLSFLSHALKSLRETPLTHFQKLLLFPTIMRYTSSHGFKLRRLARSAFRAVYDKSAR